MSFIQMLTLAAFAIYTILFIALRLDSRIAGVSALASLVIAVIALAIENNDLARGLAMYAYCLLASAAVILAVEYFRGETERRLEKSHEEGHGEPDHKQRRLKQ